MDQKEKGLLMLCCPLGDERAHPLTAVQYRHLLQMVTAHGPESSLDELTSADLRNLGCSPENAARILRLLDREDLLQRYLSAADRRGIQVLTRFSKHYPQILRQRLGIDAPAALFCAGDLSLFNTRAMALVGSRALTEPGASFARRVGMLCAKEHVTLVSGGAAGADSAAQQSCLEYGGSVICYTAESLPDRIGKSMASLLVSEDCWEMPFSARRALSRNRLIHAQGDYVFVAQSGFGKGGTWRGTCENLERGWSPVFVCDDGSAGAAGLCERGAVPVKVKQLTSFRALSPNQQRWF